MYLERVVLLVFLFFSLSSFTILVTYFLKKLITLNNTTSDSVFLVFSSSVQWIQVLACMTWVFSRVVFRDLVTVSGHPSITKQWKTDRFYFGL